MNNFIPNEKTVQIPWWLDCRKTNWLVEAQKNIKVHETYEPYRYGGIARWTMGASNDEENK